MASVATNIVPFLIGCDDSTVFFVLLGAVWMTQIPVSPLDQTGIVPLPITFFLLIIEAN